MKTEIVFYKEWLALPKSEFKILAIAADKNPFKGNLSDMCRYFNSSTTTNNKDRLKSSIESLCKQGLIDYVHKGNTHTIKIISKETEITMKKEWFLAVKNHKYTAASVSWEMVVKFYLWLKHYGANMFVYTDAANDLNTSDSTLTAAKKVLDEDFHALRQKVVKDKNEITGEYRTKGQIIDLIPWWDIQKNSYFFPVIIQLYLWARKK